MGSFKVHNFEILHKISKTEWESMFEGTIFFTQDEEVFKDEFHGVLTICDKDRKLMGNFFWRKDSLIDLNNEILTEVFEIKKESLSNYTIVKDMPNVWGI